VTLKFGEVNARGGPGDDHRKLWVYRVKGLPVQVVAETKDWRRICDGEGGLSWVHKRVVDGKRNVLNLSGAPVPLHAKERADSRRAPTSRRSDGGGGPLQGRVVPGRGGSVKGWAPPGQLWGTVETPLCRPASALTRSDG
jgi:SH3-like domain-containing protein